LWSGEDFILLGGMFTRDCKRQTTDDVKKLEIECGDTLNHIIEKGKSA